jgi:murein DD-endopeptidase MepM/ murein hydrolase activator NlpD
VKLEFQKKIYVLVGALLLLLSISIFVLNAFTSAFSFSEDNYAAVDSVKVVDVVGIEKPIVKYGMVVNGMEVKEGVVKRNQLFSDLLKESFVPPSILQQLSLLPKKIFDFRKIAVSKKYALISQLDSPKTAVAFVYEPSPVEYVVLHLKDSLTVETHQRQITTEEKTVAGTIASSLYETIETLNISNELTNKFVDVFGWQVDFQHLQKGDRFKLIYEENLVDGQPIGIGKILGIYFEHFNNGYYAFPFSQEEGSDYFDEDGNSLRKALLRYPIEFTRISSRYSLSRFHPVVKVFRPHLGTDFAAATGTPIRTVGDGIVLDAQYSANNGNYVKIRHNGTYTTGYLHMSKIASGIVAGAHVKQGQTIGYVGSTGLATGPHLCYRFWRNGVQVDALRVDLPPSKPVDKKNWNEFEATKRELMLRLQLIPFNNETISPTVAALQ